MGLFLKMDSAQPWQLGFQNPATPAMEGIIFLHNYIFMYLIFVFTVVAWMLCRAVWFFWEENNQMVDNVTHNSRLEIIWTVTPSIILLLIAVPSFSLLYNMEELARPMLTVKAIGRQWYWSYELDTQRRDFIYPYLRKLDKHAKIQLRNQAMKAYNRRLGLAWVFSGGKTIKYSKYNTGQFYNAEKDFPHSIAVAGPSLSFDSYMVQEEDLKLGSLRLLEVDNRLCLPFKTHIRILTTSSDVIHSWAVPSFGIKMDAIPGRLNQTMLFIKRKGVFYGQCSELCGVNHGYMPIVVEVVDHKKFTEWVRERSQFKSIAQAVKKIEIRDIDIIKTYRES